MPTKADTEEAEIAKLMAAGRALAPLLVIWVATQIHVHRGVGVLDAVADAQNLVEEALNIGDRP